MRTIAFAVTALLLAISCSQAQNADKQKAVVQMYDAKRGIFLVSVTTPDGTGNKIVEMKINEKTKFLDDKDKPFKDGFDNPAFKSPNNNNRMAVPVTISFEKDGSIKSIKLEKK